MTVGWTGHLAAAGLVGLDLLARTGRLRILLRAAGQRIGDGDALRANVLADFGSAITPMRVGGEPARAAGLRMAGVPWPRVVGALATEVAVAAPVTIAIGAGLVVAFGGQWWRDAGLRVQRTPGPIGLWLAAVVIVAGSAWWVRRRSAKLGAGRTRSPSGDRGTAAVAPAPGGRRALGAGARVVALAALLSAVNVGCRIAILPVLMWSAGGTTAVGTVALGAFLLTYGQLVTPSPAGVGMIDAAFLAGGAGAADLGLLLAWRLYTTGIGAGLGGLVAALYLGRFRILRASR